MNYDIEDFINVEAETMTLGTVLKKPNVMDALHTLVEESDFYYPEHRQLFSLYVDLYERNSLDLATVKQVISKQPIINVDNPIEYLMKLYYSVPTVHLAEQYAEKVRELSIKRKGLYLSEQIMALTMDKEIDNINDYISGVHSLVGMIDSAKKGNMLKVDQFIDHHLKEKFNGEHKQFPLVGISDIDVWMNGIGDNRLIVVAGRPGSGKTAIMLQTCYNVSRQGFGAVPVFSMEMSKEELVDRLLSNLSGVPFSKIIRKDLDNSDKQKVSDSAKVIKQSNLLFDDTPRMDIHYIVSQCRKIKREHGKLGCVAIDYLGLIDRRQKKNQSTSDAIGEITRECKLLAKELGCSIFLLVQMNREIDKRATKRPVMSDLRDSGSIEQDADMIIFLNRDEEKGNGKIAHVDFIVAKGRQTGMKDFELSFVGDIQRIGSKAVYMT